MNPLRDAALSYASRGWRLFPCAWIEGGACSCRDPECISPGKHPLTPHGLLDATNDPTLVGDFWTKFPKANIAIATGEKSGIAVVDVDDIKLGKPELSKILPGYDLRSVPMQQTGKGWHLVFGYPGVHVKTCTKFLPGLDSRGDGGYIMAAPSGHISGKQYQWKVAANGSLPVLPLPLLSAINGPSNGNGEDKPRFDSSIIWEGIAEGQRDDQLFRYAGKMRHADTPRESADRLICEAAALCKPPFPERDALKKVEQVYQKYPASDQPAREEKSKAPATAHHFTLISAKDLLAEPDVETKWLLEGMLIDAGMSLLVAKPKVGKTTFAFYLAVAVARGDPFLGYKTSQGQVVYLALEENRHQIKQQLRDSGIAEELIQFHFGAAPIDAIREVLPLIVETKAKFLVIDVLQKFIRVRDMNDYAMVTAALEPIMDAARKQNCHVMLTHHAGKMSREDGDDILGSTALLGGVDTLVQIKKHDKRRAFFTIQRYGEDIGETVIDLSGGGLVAVGSRQDVDIEETRPLILAVLQTETLTKTELYERVEKNKTIVSKAVDLLVESKELFRSGSGKRNDAYKFSALLPSDTIEGNKAETKTAPNPTESKQELCLDHFLKNQTPQGSFQGRNGGAFLAPENPPKRFKKGRTIAPRMKVVGRGSSDDSHRDATPRNSNPR